MKKMWEIRKLLAALLLAALAGCGPAGVEPLGEDEISYLEMSERGGHELVMWHSMTAGAGALLEELVAEFNAGPGALLGISVEAVFQGSYADSSAQLRALLNTGNTAGLPDIAQIDATGMLDIQASPYLAAAGSFARLDPDFDIGAISRQLRANIEYRGRLLGMPFAASSNILFYNADMLRAAGFHEPPSTLAEMAAMLPALAAGGADGFALSPATPTVQNWVGQQNGVSFMVDARNGRDGVPTRVVFDEDGTMAVFLREWRALHETGGLRHIEGNTFEEFAAGRVAMMVGSSSNVAAAEAAIAGRFEMGAAFFPRVNADAAYGSTVGGSSLFMFNKGELSRMWAAWEVLKFLASPGVQARWSMGTGYLAASYLSLEDEGYVRFLDENPNFAVAMRQLEAGSDELVGLWVPSAFQFFGTLRDGIIAMLERGLTVEETVQSLADELNRLLDDFHAAN